VSFVHELLDRGFVGMVEAVAPAAGNHGVSRGDGIEKGRRRGGDAAVMTDLEKFATDLHLRFQNRVLCGLLAVSGEHEVHFSVRQAKDQREVVDLVLPALPAFGGMENLDVDPCGKVQCVASAQRFVSDAQLLQLLEGLAIAPGGMKEPAGIEGPDFVPPGKMGESASVVRMAVADDDAIEMGDAQFLEIRENLPAGPRRTGIQQVVLAVGSAEQNPIALAHVHDVNLQ
jgi:hypothetical protein